MWKVYNKITGQVYLETFSKAEAIWQWSDLRALYGQIVIIAKGDN